ncbi:SRPBCC family protein [Parasphingorhabdus sp.]|uniref:SRPBCC family protein n=1 Tax=Parasphingorhabdus sp. TaxID=2709688 RepID=UPI0030017A4C
MATKPYIQLADHRVLIEAPITSVFDFLANHENYALWYPNVISIISANPLPHGHVGKIYQEDIRLPTRRVQQINITVVESRSPNLFVTEGDFVPLHPRMEVHLSEQASGETMLHWRFYSRSQSTIGRWLIPLLLGKTLQRDSGIGLARMKAIVESEAE